MTIQRQENGCQQAFVFHHRPGSKEETSEVELSRQLHGAVRTNNLETSRKLHNRLKKHDEEVYIDLIYEAAIVKMTENLR